MLVQAKSVSPKPLHGSSFGHDAQIQYVFRSEGQVRDLLIFLCLRGVFINAEAQFETGELKCITFRTPTKIADRSPQPQWPDCSSDYFLKSKMKSCFQSKENKVTPANSILIQAFSVYFESKLTVQRKRRLWKKFPRNRNFVFVRDMTKLEYFFASFLFFDTSWHSS